MIPDGLSMQAALIKLYLYVYLTTEVKEEGTVTLGESGGEGRNIGGARGMG